MIKDSLSDQPRILPCPACGEMIYSNVTTCRFCSSPVDSHAAELGADIQAKTNDAVNSAKMIRNIAAAMWFFLGVLRLIPFLNLMGLIAAVPCFLIVGVGLVYWQLKYGRIETIDADYKNAKSNWWFALALWVLMLFVLPLVLRAFFTTS
jgi:hypothetical protein